VTCLSESGKLSYMPINHLWAYRPNLFYNCSQSFQKIS